MAANDSRDYYKILGVQPGASADEITKAYKRKQIEYYPTGPARRKIKNSAEYQAMSPEAQAKKEAELDEMASKINEAYKVLSNEESKVAYDNGMGDFADPNSFGGFGGFGGFEGFGSFEDIIRNMQGGHSRGRQRKAEDIECTLNIEMKDVFVGKKCKFRVKVDKKCESCGGKGGKELKTCGKCKGKGSVMVGTAIGNMVARREVLCPDCEGRCQTVSGAKCSECKGNGVMKDTKILEVDIEPGMVSGKRIVCVGSGNESYGVQNGDVIFNIAVTETEDCYRIENDCYCKAEIDILTVMTGGVLQFDHPDGRKLAVNVAATAKIERDFAIVLGNEGFVGSRGVRGNLYIIPTILLNTGLDARVLSSYLPPLVAKKPGNYTSINGKIGRLPGRKDKKARENAESEGGFNFGFGGIDLGSFMGF